jgi:hypothetical protein
VLYFQAVRKIRQSAKQFHGQNQRDRAIKNVTKMAATASLVLIACWLPNQVRMGSCGLVGVGERLNIVNGLGQINLLFSVIPYCVFFYFRSI